MRQWMNLFENEAVQRDFYMHVSRLKNLASIKKRGLVPNHGGGNYDDMRWESLNGVYASINAPQLSTYLRAHDIEDYVICVIEVDMKTALPDEDTIDIIFDHVLERMLRADGLTQDALEDEEFFPGGEAFGSYVERLVAGFHKLAGAAVQTDEEALREAAEIWLTMKVGADDGDGMMVWAELKDKIVRQYPTMQHPVYQERHSIRIPSTVKFKGPTRIVALITVSGEDVEVVYNEVPPEYKVSVTEMVERLIYG